MERKKLYLMRHGKTVMNEQKLNQGWWDSPLSEEGIEEARLTGRFLESQGLKFDHAYSSTSERACDTLELALPDMPYQRVKGLKEFNFGLYEGKPGFLNPPRPFGEFFAAYGGDSDETMQKRIVETLTEIMKKPDHQQVFAVSHGASSASFLRKWLANSPVNSYNSPIPNCTIFVFEFDDQDQFYLVDILYPAKQKELLEKGENYEED